MPEFPGETRNEHFSYSIWKQRLTCSESDHRGGCRLVPLGPHFIQVRFLASTSFDFGRKFSTSKRPRRLLYVPYHRNRITSLGSLIEAGLNHLNGLLTRRT